MFDKLGYTRLNNWQAEFIYRNETSMAYGAGQWAKLQDVSTRFPYWQYSTVKDHRVRLEHRVLEGKIFLASDKEFYPPIGWNCRCTAIPLSARQAEKLGIKGPDTVTQEMRANLSDAEFIGDKVKNFEDWLNLKLSTISQQAVQLIVNELNAIVSTIKDNLSNQINPITP